MKKQIWYEKDKPQLWFHTGLFKKNSYTPTPQKLLTLKSHIQQ